MFENTPALMREDIKRGLIRPETVTLYSHDESHFPIKNPMSSPEWETLTDLQQSRRFKQYTRQCHEFAALSRHEIGHKGIDKRTKKPHRTHKNTKFLYVTDRAVQQREEQKARSLAWARSKDIYKDGQRVCSMADIYTNKAKRKYAEMLAMLSGIQALATENGQAWAMATITAPPEFHPNPSNGHCTWNRSTPREAIKNTAKKWQLFRARCAKEGITITYLAVGEPTGDATPHSHQVMCYNPSDLVKIKEILLDICGERGFDLIEGEEQKTAKTKKAKNNKNKKAKIASFATYAIKYATDTLEIGEVKTKKESKKRATAQRVAAFRSVWGQRGSSFGGIPPLYIWKNLKKTRYQAAPGTVLHSLIKTVKDNDSAEYFRMSGGLCVKNSHRPIRTYTPKAFAKAGFDIKEPDQTWTHYLHCEADGSGMFLIKENYEIVTTNSDSTDTEQIFTDSKNDIICLKNDSVTLKTNYSRVNEKGIVKPSDEVIILDTSMFAISNKDIFRIQNTENLEILARLYADLSGGMYRYRDKHAQNLPDKRYLH